MSEHLMTRRSLMALAGAAPLARPALAQESYPSQPIRVVVPFPAGATTDLRARIFAERMAMDWKQPVIVDNRGGANGFIAAEMVARAKPDGYTVFFGSNTVFVTNPAMFRKLPYDPVADFAPITLMGVSPMVVLVNNNFPARSVAEFIAYAKARPGQLNFASGNGSSRGGSELFRSMAGLDMVHIGYQSSPQALTALMAGDVHLLIVDGGAGVPPVKDGQLRAIATTGQERMGALAEVPTVMEAGLPGYEFASWTAVFAPRAVPAAIIDRLHAKIVEIGQRPEIEERMRSDGSVPRFGTPAQLAHFVQEDGERWRRIVAVSGMGEG